MINRFFSRYSFTIIILVVFFLPVLTRGARMAMTSNDNKVEDWLPKEYPETQDLRWFKQHFENETFILISWEGCKLDDPRLELLETKLLAHENLIYPKPATLIQAGLIKLFPPKVAPEPTIGPPLFASVETGRTMMNRLTEGTTKLSEEEASHRLAGLFVGQKDPQQSCAIVTLTDEAKRDLRHTLDNLYEICQRELALPRERVKMGGPPVDNVAISTEGEKTLVRLFGPAGIVGLALAYWCLRSTRLTMMVFVTALYAGAISLSLVYYSGSAMNAILLTMPAVVYVAGISGAIHFANYYRGSAVEGGVEGAPARAVHNAWIPCTLSAVTSAAGLASLYTSELIPIKMFGIYTALGVLTTLALLFLFLPAWMQLWPMRKDSALDGDAPKAEDIALPVGWRNFLSGCLRRWPLMLAGGVALLAVCGYGLFQINTSIKLTKLFSSGAEIIKNYEWLETNLGPLVPMEVVLRFDNNQSSLTMMERAELVNRVQKSLQEIDVVGNTMSAVTFAPPLPTKRAGIFSKDRLRYIWNSQLEKHREEYIDGGFLALDGDAELWRINARVGALNDVDYGLFLNDLRAKVEPVLLAERERVLKAKAKADKTSIDAEAARPGGLAHGRESLAAGNRCRLHRTGAGRLQGPGPDADRVEGELHLGPADHRRGDDDRVPRRFGRLDLAGSQRVSGDGRLRLDGLVRRDDRRRHDHDSDRGAGRLGRRRRPLFDLVSPRPVRRQIASRFGDAGLRRLRSGDVSKLERVGPGAGRVRPELVRADAALRGDDVLPADGRLDRQSADSAGRAVQSDRDVLWPRLGPQSQKAAGARIARGAARRAVRIGAGSEHGQTGSGGRHGDECADDRQQAGDQPPSGRQRTGATRRTAPSLGPLTIAPRYFPAAFRAIRS